MNQGLTQQNSALQLRLGLAEKMLSLKSLEAEESMRHVVDQMEIHLENLKGDYLTSIIGRIKKHVSRATVCMEAESQEQSLACLYSRDVTQGNSVMAVTQEVMKTFGTLLKQL